MSGMSGAGSSSSSQDDAGYLDAIESLYDAAVKLDKAPKDDPEQVNWIEGFKQSLKSLIPIVSHSPESVLFDNLRVTITRAARFNDEDVLASMTAIKRLEKAVKDRIGASAPAPVPTGPLAGLNSEQVKAKMSSTLNEIATSRYLKETYQRYPHYENLLLVIDDCVQRMWSDGISPWNHEWHDKYLNFRDNFLNRGERRESAFDVIRKFWSEFDRSFRPVAVRFAPPIFPRVVAATAPRPIMGGSAGGAPASVVSTPEIPRVNNNDHANKTNNSAVMLNDIKALGDIKSDSCAAASEGSSTTPFAAASNRGASAGLTTNPHLDFMRALSNPYIPGSDLKQALIDALELTGNLYKDPSKDLGFFKDELFVAIGNAIRSLSNRGASHNDQRELQRLLETLLQPIAAKSRDTSMLFGAVCHRAMGLFGILPSFTSDRSHLSRMYQLSVKFVSSCSAADGAGLK